MVNSVTNTASSYYPASSTGSSAQSALKALLKLLQSSQSSSGASASNQSSNTDPAQALFNQIDTNGTGSITKSDLETAVTKAGGTKQGADALWSKLDPNNTGSVSESQFAQNLPKPPGSQGGNAAQNAILKLIQSSNASGHSSSNPIQTLFDQIDTSGKGSITKSDLETAVTKAGGTKQAADALWSKLDPNNTGSVIESQFAQNLPKPQGLRQNSS
jgi:Ca2+-binding EF-hand superfamily protein